MSQLEKKTQTKGEPIMNQPENIKLGVLPNNCMIDEPCSICGEWHTPEIPYWIYMDRSKAVCYGCAKKHNPHLLKVVCAANTKQWDDVQREKKETENKKKKLLEHYSQKPPSDFIQYDAFVSPEWHDGIVQPNPKTEVAVMSGTTTELMGTCNEVRVLISKEATKSQVLRGIKEIFNSIKTEGCKKDNSLYQSYKDRMDKQMEIDWERDGIPF
jgi:hypothetical protein